MVKKDQILQLKNLNTEAERMVRLKNYFLQILIFSVLVQFFSLYSLIELNFLMS